MNKEYVLNMVDQFISARKPKFAGISKLAKAGCVSLAVALAGCSSDTFEVPEGFYGMVSADEPRAALRGEDILVNGGSAVDAAVAMFFTLSATLPSSAGLSAGGSCAISDKLSERFDVIEFFAKPASSAPNAIAIPLAPRAMFAMHARYGRDRFSLLMGEAESLARFGEVVSLQLANELSQSAGSLISDSEARDVFGNGQGGRIQQGDRFRQADLAATLGKLRRDGIGDLYSGNLAKAFVAAAERAGYSANLGTLKAALPVWKLAAGLEYDNHEWVMVAGSPQDQKMADETFRVLLDQDSWEKGVTAGNVRSLETALRGAAFKTAGGQDLANILGRSGNDVPGATSFMAVDATGQGVVCSITLNAPFGTGRMGHNLGVMFVDPHVQQPDMPSSVGVVVGNLNTNQLFLTGMAAGGRSALSVLATHTLTRYIAEEPADQAVRAPRYHITADDNMVHEPALPEGTKAAAGGMGLRLQERPKLSRSRVMYCEEALPGSEGTCDTADDTRGAGLTPFESGS